MEIISPSDSPARRIEELAGYSSIGVAELWKIDSKQETVEVYALAMAAISPIIAT